MAFGKQKLLELIAKNQKSEKDKERYAEFISLYCYSRGKGSTDWDRIMALTPPNSTLNVVLEAMRKGTDFPHQIAFFGVLHYLAGILLTKEIHIDYFGQKIYPDIWSIVLAPSGSGKSTVEKFISNVFEELNVDLAKVEDFATAKAFLQSLAKTPKGLLVKDEFAQLLNGMEKQTYLAELKDYFLKTYDNADISRTTGSDKEDIGPIQVHEPAISVYGSTVDSTISKYITTEMLLDGFAQRFNFIFCDTRTDKKAFLKHNTYKNEIVESFKETINGIEHSVYKLSPKAEKKYEELFFTNLKTFDGINYSFFRRTSFKTIKYALLYHILLQKPSEFIDEEDIIWADRITFTHFCDIRKLLNMYDEQEAFNLIDKAIDLKQRLEGKGKVFSAREITQYIKGTKIAEAKILAQLVNDIVKQEEENKKLAEDKLIELGGGVNV